MPTSSIRQSPVVLYIASDSVVPQDEPDESCPSQGLGIRTYPGCIVCLMSWIGQRSLNRPRFRKRGQLAAHWSQGTGMEVSQDEREEIVL